MYIYKLLLNKLYILEKDILYFYFKHIILEIF